MSCVIFLCAVVLLVTHAQTHLTVALIGVAITILTLICFAKDAKEIIRGVDYQTLLFFIGLFVVVGGLEQTGVLVMIAEFIWQAVRRQHPGDGLHCAVDLRGGQFGS